MSKSPTTQQAERYLSALRRIIAESYKYRRSVTPDNAWDEYLLLNKHYCEVIDIAKLALNDAANTGEL